MFEGSDLLGINNNMSLLFISKVPLVLFIVKKN